MKSMLRKGLAFFLCLSMALTMAACGGGGGSGTENGKTSADSSPEKTTIVYQTWNPDTNTFPIVKEAFEKKYPDITVDHVFVQYSDHIQKLKVDLASGQGPDAFSLQTGATMDEFRDFQEELTPLAAKEWGDTWKDNLLPIAVELGQAKDGKFYGLPMGTSYAGTIWADLSYFEKYGLNIPKNLEELKEVCAQFRAHGEYPLAIGAKDDWINLDMWMNIANDIDSTKLYSALDGKTPFTDAGLVQSFQIWQSLFQNGVFQDGALGVNMYNDVDDLFTREGSIPLYCVGSWAINSYPPRGDADREKIFNGGEHPHTVFTMDWNNDGKTAPLQGGVENMLCMNKDGDKKDAAWKFVSFMMNDGQNLLNNSYLMYFPSQKNTEVTCDSLSEEGQKNLDILLDLGANHVAGYRENPYPDLKLAIANNLKSLAIGEISPEKAAEQIEQASKSAQR